MLGSWVLCIFGLGGKFFEYSSIEEILVELAKLRAVKIGGSRRLTEITKKQRTILEKME